MFLLQRAQIVVRAERGAIEKDGDGVELRVLAPADKNLALTLPRLLSLERRHIPVSEDTMREEGLEGLRIVRRHSVGVREFPLGLLDSVAQGHNQSLASELDFDGQPANRQTDSGNVDVQCPRRLAGRRNSVCDAIPVRGYAAPLGPQNQDRPHDHTRTVVVAPVSAVVLPAALATSSVTAVSASSLSAAV